MPNARRIRILLQHLMFRMALYMVRAARRRVMPPQPQPAAPMPPQDQPRRARRSAAIPRVRLTSMGMTGQQILTTYRFDMRTIQNIFTEIEDQITPLIDIRTSIPPMLKLLCTLHFCATGTFQHGVALLHGIAQSTLSRVLVQVMGAIVKRVDHHISMPTSVEAMNAAKAAFHTIAQFPGVIGCIDCTHVAVVPPTAHEAAFRNRKMSHSLNVQMVCGADLCILQVCARFPGSAHDARILRASRLYDHMEQVPRRTYILGECAERRWDSRMDGGMQRVLEECRGSWRNAEGQGGMQRVREECRGSGRNAEGQGGEEDL